MRYPVLSLSMILVCGSVQAQSSDWRVVQALPPGSRVVVGAVGHWRGSPCKVDCVREAEIDCEHGGQVFTFARSGVETVSRSHVRAGKVIGAIAGSTILGTKGGMNATNQSDSVFVIAAIAVGALLGWLVGGAVGHFAGSTIYVRP